MTLPINTPALLQDAGAGGGYSSATTFLLFGGMIALFYFLLIRPQQRQRKQLEEKISKLKSGDEVLLTSGLYATVDRVDGHLLYLKIGNNLVKARRNAVAALSGEADGQQKPGVFS